VAWVRITSNLFYKVGACDASYTIAKHGLYYLTYYSICDHFGHLILHDYVVKSHSYYFDNFLI